jgi:hypothetical protein
MPRAFKREIPGGETPAIDVPDWELVGRLVALFHPYAPAEAVWSFHGEDQRGRYSEADVDAFRAAVEGMDDPPHAITIDVYGTDAGGEFRRFVVSMAAGEPSYGTAARFTSSDEAVVVHLQERTADLFRRAAERRHARLEAGRDMPLAPSVSIAPPSAIEVSEAPSVAIASASAMEVSEATWWETWGVATVVAVVATVVGGLILAAILGAL